ncbi:MAG: tRNA-dihydrouridine synthase family protein [Clostridia bacterium]|nr:tRNA-dihydrouridine synthase family protein [Clostridia bacterium]
MKQPLKLCYAPLEGITDTKFRVIHASLFSDVDHYYAPFVSPTHDSPFVEKEYSALRPENNPGVTGLVPQVLVNQPDLMLDSAERLGKLGYKEVNLNVGCPSGTVVSKKKGAGFLGEPDMLDRFFDTVFSDPLFRDGNMKLSVKTRLGLFDPAEFDDILAIYNRYPISEVILHPRVRTEMYRGTPHTELLAKIVSECVHPLCYSGDIFTVDDWNALSALLPEDREISLMLGRGAVANPGLFTEIRTGKPLDKAQFAVFTEALMQDACTRLSGERHILFRLKELWGYFIVMFCEPAVYAKRLRKATTLSEFRSAAESVFLHCEIKEHAGFVGNANLKNVP